MHIPDGILTPGVCAAAGVVSAGLVALSLRRLQSTPNLRAVPLTAVLAGLIFAGQMVNFRLPLPGTFVSGHLIGGVLAAVIAGPWAGCLALSLVLLVQLLLYADGGFLAYGANVLNMGIVGSMGGYAVFDCVRRRISGNRGVIIGAVVASWVSVVAASTLFCIEFIAAYPQGLRGGGTMASLFAAMTTYHSVIGVGEAIITGLVVSYVVAVRPDLIHGSPPTEGWMRSTGRIVWTGVVAALAVAAFAAPFASEAADGLEQVATELKFASDEKPTALVLDEYKVPIPGAAESSVVWQKISVSLAGLLGTAVVLAVAYGLSRATVRGETRAELKT